MIKRLLILLILLVAVPCWGANVYIDPLCGTGAPHYACGDGTSYTTPEDDWDDLTVTAGNDYRQLCGTTFTDKINNITANGTSENYIIIGAYYISGGNPVHEDDSPTFGQDCGNAVEKPKIDTSGEIGKASDTITLTGNYLEVNSLQFYSLNTALYHRDIIDNRGDYNIVRYVYIVGGFYGVRSYGNYGTYEYNYMDGTENDADSDEIGMADPFGFSGSDYCTVQYNVVGNYDHGGVGLHYSDNNTIQYNYFFMGAEGGEDFAWSIAGPSSVFSPGAGSDNNTFQYNYSDNAGKGFQLWAGLGNVINANVFKCNGPVQPGGGNGSCIDIYSQSGDPYTGSYITGNYFYNNVVYDSDRVAATHSMRIYVPAGADASNDISGNFFVNNIFQKTSGNCIFVLDSQGSVVGTNYWYNNSCYDNGDDYADIAGVPYSDAEAFNALDFATGNIDTDPGLNDPAGNEFWPASTGSAVYQAGYDVGAPYDTLLLSTSNFTASPPSVLTDQFANDYIGAYGLVGAGTPTYPIQGAAGNFKLN